MDYAATLKFLEQQKTLRKEKRSQSLDKVWVIELEYPLIDILEVISMELLEGIETRRSFRAFKPTPIPKEILGQILKVASNSPSYPDRQSAYNNHIS